MEQRHWGGRGPLTRTIAAWGGADGSISTRRVGDLLDSTTCRWSGGDRRLLAAAADRVLYKACRDVLEPVTVGSLRWRADLVCYEPGVLPTGELHRSLGHWNSPAQYEMFEVISGAVLMIIASPSGQLSQQRLDPGDLAAVPMGAWHLTYVLTGPAFVFNVYADERDLTHEKFGRDDAVRCWVREGRDGPEIRNHAEDHVASVRDTAALTRASLAGRSLSEAHASGDGTVFDAVVLDCQVA